MSVGKLLDFQIIVSICMSAVSWKIGDWRSWQKYYPTMLYFIVGEFLYDILCYNYRLWSFESPLLKQTFSSILIALVFYPATILVYLPHMPTEIKKQIPYILMWVGIFTTIERVSYLLGFFAYQHGWNIWLSVLFNCVMFPLLWLHYKKPLWAAVALVACTGIGLVLFQVPINSMK